MLTLPADLRALGETLGARLQSSQHSYHSPFGLLLVCYCSHFCPRTLFQQYCASGAYLDAIPPSEMWFQNIPPYEYMVGVCATHTLCMCTLVTGWRQKLPGGVLNCWQRLGTERQPSVPRCGGDPVIL